MANQKDIRGWTKASFFDPATGDVVQMNRIIPDFSAWEPDVIQTEDSVGSIYGGRTFNLEVGSPDVNDDKKLQLAEWMDDGTPIRAVVYNPHGKSILWLHSEDLFYVPAAGTTASDGADVHTCQLGFTGVGSMIYQHTNLIGPADVDFPVIFPVAGARVTYSITTATVDTLTIYFKDFDGDTLTQKQVATQPGRNSVSEITPAGIYQITIDEPADATEQALRTDGSDQYTAT